MSIVSTLLATATLVGGLLAQVPYRYLVTAESAGTSTASGFTYVDPATGVGTVAVPIGSVQARLAMTVALDPADPMSIWFSSGLSSSIVPVITRAGVLGSRIQTITTYQMRGVGGGVSRYHVEGTNMLFTMPAGTLPGLHRVPLLGGTTQQLLALPSAHELVVHNGKAYVATYTAAMPTTIVEVDLATLQNRVLGSAYPPARALTPFGVNLLLGDDNGDLHILDVTTGIHSPLQRAGHGAVVAAVTDPLAALFYYATDRNEVWRFPDLGRPLYTTTNRLNDIDVGVHDRAAFLQFGTGCTGTNGLKPAFEHVGIPTIPNPAYGLQVANARANSAAVLAIGTSRTQLGAVPLPLGLDFIGMTGCTLYQDLLVALPQSSDGNGRVIVPFPMPNDPTLRGAHFVAQAFVIDPGANPANLVASDGGEGIAR